MGKINYQELTISPAVGFTVAETKEAYKVSDKSNLNPTFMGNDYVAEYLGGYEYAIILNKLAMLTNNERVTGYQSEGKKWIRIGLFAGEEEVTWAGMLRAINPATTKRYLVQLKGDGLIDFKQFKGKGRSLYYWLNIEAVELLSQPVQRVAKLHATNSANSGLKNKSNFTTREDKSDLTSREITYNEPCNQVSRVVKLPITNRETSNSTNNTNNTNNLTTTATAFENEKIAVNEPNNSKTNTIDTLTIAYCNALEVEYRDELIFKQTKAIVMKLVSLYPDLTSDRITANIIHGLKVLKLKPAQISAKWLKLSNDTEFSENVEIRAIVDALKGIYGLGELPHDKQWEFVEAAGQVKRFYKLTPEQVASFKQCWEKKYQGMSLPKLENLLKHISIIKENNEHERNSNNNDHFAVPATGKLARVTIGVGM